MEPFEIPVSYKGKDWLFPAELMQTGYAYRIVVTIDDYKVFFEPDEERNFRAILEDVENVHARQVDQGLIKAIGEVLELILKQ